MQSKNRKINKEELELWKLVTKNDKVIGKYTTKVEEYRRQSPTSQTSKTIIDNTNILEKKNDHVKQNILYNNNFLIPYYHLIIYDKQAIFPKA